MQRFLYFRSVVCGLWSVVFVFVLFVSSVSAVPSYINYQGLLRDSAGNVVTGTKPMTFNIYSALTGGSALWTMTDSAVSVSNGLYTVKLGPIGVDALGTGTAARWLEVAVGSETLSPRLEILAVAYAITAGTAESASKLGIYSPGVSGVSIVPTTDATGKLSASVIPGSGISIDYATLSGTASTAATATYATLTGTATNAGTVDNIHASTTATASYLYPLDANSRLSGVAVSAEASGTNYALFMNGKFGVAGSCYGSGTVDEGNTTKTITDSTNLTASSMVFASGAVHTTFNPTSISVRRAANNTFSVTIGAAAPAGGYSFNYLIIN